MEELFLHTADKYLNPAVSLKAQVPITTPHGSFRLDVAFIRPSGSVYGVELDGRQYHDPEADLWRDAAILSSGGARAIFRVGGRALFRYPAEVWYLLAKLAPWILADRARSVLENQVNAGCRSSATCWVDQDSVAAELDFEEPAQADPDRDDEETSWCDVVAVERRTLDTDTVRERCAWLAKYPTLRLHAIRQLALEEGRAE